MSGRLAAAGERADVQVRAQHVPPAAGRGRGGRAGPARVHHPVRALSGLPRPAGVGDLLCMVAGAANSHCVFNKVWEGVGQTSVLPSSAVLFRCLIWLRAGVRTARSGAGTKLTAGRLFDGVCACGAGPRWATTRTRPRCCAGWCRRAWSRAWAPADASRPTSTRRGVRFRVLNHGPNSLTLFQARL